MATLQGAESFNIYGAYWQKGQRKDKCNALQWLLKKATVHEYRQDLARSYSSFKITSEYNHVNEYETSKTVP